MPTEYGVLPPPMQEMRAGQGGTQGKAERGMQGSPVYISSRYWEKKQFTLGAPPWIIGASTHLFAQGHTRSQS